MNVEEEHEDILQNIEFIVVNTFREHPEVIDYDVERVYEMLIREYARPDSEINPAFPTEIRATLYERMKHICDWRLGRAAIGQDGDVIPGPEPVTPDVIVACLKRLRRSVSKWSKRGGRQGYLNFINEYVP
jgi:hypothetical protein